MTSKNDKVPCLADAERAAAALSTAGVSRVVLFGSVARGEETEHSVINLLAIHDDIDYRYRWQRRCELVLAAEAVAGCSVDVVVTDRPEWAMRTTQVPTSLEGRAARDGVVLVDRPPMSRVDWDKEMVKPTDDYEEALCRLEKASVALSTLYQHLQVSALERIEREIGNETRAFIRYHGRLARGCGEAHAVVESSVKALIHLQAEPGVEARGHDIASLCKWLPEPYGDTVLGMLAPLQPDAVSEWHYLARYQAEGRGTTPTAELLTALTWAGCRVASHITCEFSPTHPTVEMIRDDIARISDYLDAFDIRSGELLGGVS